VRGDILLGKIIKGVNGNGLILGEGDVPRIINQQIEKGVLPAPTRSNVYVLIVSQHNN
jgi:hypothetical protein